MSAPGRVRVALAGSTGSIGTQTLEVLDAEPERFELVALAASGSPGPRLDQLIAQAQRHRPKVLAVATDDLGVVERLLAELPGCEVRAGDGALASLATDADVVVNAVVGFAGLDVTLATLRAGRRLALANKESLVAGGPVVAEARRTEGAELLPVDSEHAAIAMCLGTGTAPGSVARLVITASGGPFRTRPAAELAHVTVDDALAHPTWTMGPKITVDSSTLVNKGLEVIEAHELFGVPAWPGGFGLTFDDIEVVVHPQSIVHSMVELVDGSTLAQLSVPDMRLPIGYALAWPDRIATPFGRMDWTTAGRLDFEPPDLDRFPCLGLAYAAGRTGGTAPAWFNAANEVAVAAFLDGRIRWVDIAAVLADTLERHDGAPATDRDAVVAADAEARRVATVVVDGLLVGVTR